MSENREEMTRNIQETNRLVRALVEQETLNHPFWLGGIISRSFMSDMGHHYFDLTDDDYTISCMLPRSKRGALDFTLQNGMEVEVFGSIRIYDKKALVQIDVEKAKVIERPPFMIDDSVKDRLTRQGIYPRNKLSLPGNINKIGLVTSKNSDALPDFEDTYRRESLHPAQVVVRDVLLQGEQAPRQIADAINRLNNENDVDVIVIVRGGGRNHDLAVFNDYLIAEAICRSKIPIITGIGHQRDETFADQVADYSAITPTAAASFIAKNSARFVPRLDSQQSNTKWLYVTGILIMLVVVLAILVLLSNV
jgi:exodeoxyribonuclease VII large subunit